MAYVRFPIQKPGRRLLDLPSTLVRSTNSVGDRWDNEEVTVLEFSVSSKQRCGNRLKVTI